MKNKKLTIFLITLLSIISIFLVIFMILVLNGKFKFSKLSFKFNNTSNKLVINESYEIDFDKINISTNYTNIYVKSTNEKNIKVLVYGNEDNTSLTTSNNELSIISKEKGCFGFCFNTQMSKIEIYIPNDYSKSLKISNSYGDIKIDNFVNLNIDIDSDCGDVSVLGGNIVNIKDSYGDISLEQSNKSKIVSESGNIKIGTVSNITVLSNYGDIDINNVNEYLNISVDCGDVKIDTLKLTKNSIIKNNLGDIKINKTNKLYFDAKTDLGNVKINNNYHKSDVILKINNDCGDIKIRN